jgi:hypothetical protein
MKESLPTAIVLSNREAQENVPASSSTGGLTLLELARLDVEPEVWNEMILADGKVKRTSTCGSDPDVLETGKLAERRGTGVAGINDAIVASAKE